MILKPDLCMQSGKIDPKVGKTDPHLEKMKLSRIGRPEE